jgi:uncharacterized phage protein (TIGR02218 family)
MNPNLLEHLATGLTTLCQCWSVVRKDGETFGFTDHDQTLTFAGITFRAESGMTSKAVVRGTGLAVDNSEAMGILSDMSITEADIAAGRFDGAEVRIWLVNWQKPGERTLRFRGTIGEVRRGAGAFHAELRGLSELLNQPQGRVYQRGCSAVLGDRSCRFDLESPGYAAMRDVQLVDEARVFSFTGFGSFQARWFERGRLSVLSGEGRGLFGTIKHDQISADGRRVIELWEPIPAVIRRGDAVRLDAGCDRRALTCRTKFNNMLNFQGFPFIPGEDWLVSTPVNEADATGGRREL